MTRRFQTSQTGEQLPAEDSRQAFRIPLDPGIVLELAIWFSKSTEVTRVHLKDLGPPTFVMGKPPFPLIDNISAGGLGLSFSGESSRRITLFQSHVPLALVYFKIQDPAGSYAPPLSFMAGYEVKRVQYLSGRINLGMSLALDGVPHPGELVLDFVDARKYGNSCLTRWCHDMQRRRPQGASRKTFPGIRLDMLLSQLEMAMAEMPGHAM